MTTTKFLTTVFATTALPALVFLGAGTAHAFNPQPDPPSVDSSVRQSGVADPASRVANMGPGVKVGLGGPDTHPTQLGGPDTHPGQLGGPDTQPGH